jgi:hypothetical protein
MKIISHWDKKKKKSMLNILISIEKIYRKLNKKY